MAIIGRYLRGVTRNISGLSKLVRLFSCVLLCRAVVLHCFVCFVCVMLFFLCCIDWIWRCCAYGVITLRFSMSLLFIRLLYWFSLYYSCCFFVLWWCLFFHFIFFIAFAFYLFFYYHFWGVGGGGGWGVVLFWGKGKKQTTLTNVDVLYTTHRFFISNKTGLHEYVHNINTIYRYLW